MFGFSSDSMNESKFYGFLKFSRGKCRNCEKILTKSTITDEEFRLVRQNFEEKVVRGVDIYHKTTLDEWNAFMELIQKNGPFDIVVDGLNVSFKSIHGSLKQQKPRGPNPNLVSNW